MVDISESELANHANTHAIVTALYNGLVALYGVLGGLLTGSATWDAASIADGDMESKDVTVTGAAIGDFVLASMGVDVADLGVSAQVTATNTVTVTLLNNTGGAVDLASTTVRVVVFPRAAMVAPTALTVTA